LVIKNIFIKGENLLIPLFHTDVDNFCYSVNNFIVCWLSGFYCL